MGSALWSQAGDPRTRHPASLSPSYLRRGSRFGPVTAATATDRMTKHLTNQSSMATRAPGVAGRSACDAVLRWDIVLPDSSCLTDPQHEGWLETGRWLLWCSRMEPPFGRRPCNTGTLRSKIA